MSAVRTAYCALERECFCINLSRSFRTLFTTVTIKDGSVHLFQSLAGLILPKTLHVLVSLSCNLTDSLAQICIFDQVKLRIYHMGIPRSSQDRR